MTLQKKIRIIGAVIGIIGFIIIGVWGSWALAVGIFLTMYGDNMSKWKALKEPYQDIQGPNGGKKKSTFQQRLKDATKKKHDS